MAETPIARLSLDSRKMGPSFCSQCDADIEDAILMSDGSVVCEYCGTPVSEFDVLEGLIVSARTLKPGEVDPSKFHCCDDACRSRGCTWERPDEEEA